MFFTTFNSITVVCLITAVAFNFYDANKKPDKAYVVPDKNVQATNTNTTNETYQSRWERSRNFVMNKLYDFLKILLWTYITETLTSIAILFLIISIVQWIKGRLNWNNQLGQSILSKIFAGASASAGSTNTATVQIFNSGYEGHTGKDMPRDNPNITKYEGETDPEIWLELFEAKIDLNKRKETLLEFLHPKCLEGIPNFKKILQDKDSYDQIKLFIMSKYGNLPLKKDESYNVIDVVNRKQKADETVQDYANELIKMAKLALPNLNEEQLDNTVRPTIINGIINEKIRKEIENENSMSVIRREPLTLAQFINLCISKENSEKRTNNTTQKNSEINAMQTEDKKENPNENDSKRNFKNKRFKNRNPYYNNQPNNNFNNQPSNNFNNQSNNNFNNQPNNNFNNQPNNNLNNQQNTNFNNQQNTNFNNQQNNNFNNQQNQNNWQPPRLNNNVMNPNNFERRRSQSANNMNTNNVDRRAPSPMPSTNRNTQFEKLNNSQPSFNMHYISNEPTQGQDNTINDGFDHGPLNIWNEQNYEINNNHDCYYYGSEICQAQNPIIGKAIFNNTLVRYLCDTGADITVISERVFNKLRLEDNNTRMLQYQGKDVKSVNGKLSILGEINLNKCILYGSAHFEGITIVVIKENLNHYDCILGRDVIDRITKMKDYIQKMRVTINQMSREVEEYYEILSAKKRISTNENMEIGEEFSINRISLEKYPTATNDETLPFLKMKSDGNYIVFGGWPSMKTIENKQEELNSQLVKEPKLPQIDEKKWQETRERVYKQLEACSANSMCDLEPTKNKDSAFRIELKNPDIEPIKSKMRPVAYHLKSKLQTELVELEKAGIIRKAQVNGLHQLD
jgi:hypothetical protein